MTQPPPSPWVAGDEISAVTRLAATQGPRACGLRLPPRPARSRQRTGELHRAPGPVGTRDR